MLSRMNRHLNSLAIVKIIDALNIRRQAALLSLPYVEGDEVIMRKRRRHDFPSTAYARQMTAPLNAERECNELVEAAIADAISLQPPQKSEATRESALSLSESSLVPPQRGDNDSDGTRGSAKLPSQQPTPCAEIGSALEGRRLQGLALDGLRFTASFNRSDLSLCSLKRCYAVYSTFNLARLNEVNLSGAQVHSCTFVGAEARHVMALNCRFSHCQFKQCDMHNWDVRGATFFRCSFSLSDLSGWVYDGQTTVIEPVDWSRCRRLAWHVNSQLPVGDCRVVGKGTEKALSLPPPAKPRKA